MALTTIEEGVFQNTEREGGSATPKSSWPALIGFVGLCLLVGAVTGVMTARSVGSWYLSLARPPGTPPNWVFGPVWTVLYVMIGIAGWLVWRESGPSRAIRLWGWQLLLNGLWAPSFFGLHNPAIAMAVIAVLLVAIALTVRAFQRWDRRAAWLMAPYFLWTCYAAWLNAGFLWLNPKG